MSHRMQAGDRIRVTARCALRNYGAGDTGIVAHGPLASSNGMLHYFHVVLDKDGPNGKPVIFTEGEIEPDV